MNSSSDGKPLPSPELLAALPLFEGMEPADLAEIATWFEVEHRDAGSPLIREGAPGYAFYVLTEGTAEVTHGGELLRQLARGDFFGEKSIIGDGRRTATVMAASPVTYLSLFGTDFRDLEARFPDLAARINSAYA